MVELLLPRRNEPRAAGTGSSLTRSRDLALGACHKEKVWLRRENRLPSSQVLFWALM